MKWYLQRSRINTNKREATRIAKKLRVKGNYSNVQIKPRVLKADKKTGTPRSKGYWIKVNKK